MLKKCKDCGVEKEASEDIESFFSKSVMNKDGFCSFCKPCMSKRTKKYRENNIGKWNNSAKERYLKNREKIIEMNKLWQKNNPEIIENYKKRRTIIRLNKNKNRGSDEDIPSVKIVHTVTKHCFKKNWLIPQPCILCGNPNSVAHHSDYSKPFLIDWLCSSHHSELHGANGIDLGFRNGKKSII
jgi:hypothetical protein